MAEAQVTIERRGAVAVLVLDNPPVNLLNTPLRNALRAALVEATDDPEIEAIVLAARGRSFPAGADISEFDDPSVATDLGDLCNAVEACPKPVVAALHGTVLGGGFELALAAHYRIAHQRTQIGFPEVRLGVLPGAGGTQRAPRLAGAANALALMLSGTPIAVTGARAAPYIDRVTGASVLDAAVALAEDCVAENIQPRRSLQARAGLSDPPAFEREIDRNRQALTVTDALAKHEIVTAVEAALLLPAEAGLAFEAAAFEACNATPEAKALQHVFFAERDALKPPAALRAAAVLQLGIAGEGGLAVSLATAALDAGLSVAHFVARPAEADALRDAIGEVYERRVESRTLSRLARAERLTRLTQSTDAAVIAGADLVIGCGAGQGALLAETDGYAAAHAALVTTDRLDLVAVSPLIGLVVAPDSQVAEVLWSDQSAPEAVARVMRAMHQIGRRALALRETQSVVAQMRGMQVALTEALVGRGVPVRHIVRVMGQRGVLWPTPVLDETASVAPDIDDAEIVAFLETGMASAGLKLLRDGVVQRPGDIDMLGILALGYARHSGGPLYMATRDGLLALDRRLARHCETDPALFASAPELERLIKDGKAIGDLARPSS